MAHVHESHGHGSTTVVERDGEGPATALIVLIVVAALALLIWFFAFSGIVIDRGRTMLVRRSTTSGPTRPTTRTPIRVPARSRSPAAPADKEAIMGATLLLLLLALVLFGAGFAVKVLWYVAVRCSSCGWSSMFASRTRTGVK